MLEKVGFWDEYNSNQYLSKRVTKQIIKEHFANTSQIVFEVTQECNLACKYCVFGDNYSNHENRNDIKLDFRKVTLLIDYFLLKKERHNYSYKSIFNIGFYGGEPLLNFELIKNTVEYIKSLHISDRIISFSITTNGLLIKKYISYLLKNKFQICISLDGDETCNEMRVNKNGVSSFTTVYNNCKYIQNKYPQFFKNNINFLSVLNNSNSVEKTYDFFKNTFDKKTTFSEINRLGFNKSQEVIYNEMFRNGAEDTGELVTKRNDIFSSIYYDLLEGKKTIDFFNFSMFCFYSSYLALLNPMDKCRWPTGTCIPFSKKIYVTANGNILQCERIGHTNVLGKVTNNSVDIDYGNIADTINAFHDRMRPICEKCYDHRSCLQCGYYLDNERGEIKCSKFKNLDTYRKKIAERIQCLEEKPDSYDTILKEIDLVW